MVVKGTAELIMSKLTVEQDLLEKNTEGWFNFLQERIAILNYGGHGIRKTKFGDYEYA